MKQSFLTALTVIGLLLANSACTSKPSTPETLTTTPVAEPSAATSPQPAPIAQSNLQTYDETSSGVPVTAQYPDTMQVSSSSSGEGMGIFFTFKPQGNALDEAEVHLFLPADQAIASDLMQFVTGPNGLMETNGWKSDSTETGGSSEFPYAWVETVINFSTDQEQSGHILLGQVDGQAVQVTLLYPSEMADAYWFAAKTVLESLAFDASLLPITHGGD